MSERTYGSTFKNAGASNYAIAKLAMHNREHIVLIRPDREGLVLHTLFYPDELHISNRQSIPKKSEATKKELELASQLIKQLSAPFKPKEFHDTYRENVEKLIEQKENGEHVAKHPAKHRSRRPARANPYFKPGCFLRPARTTSGILKSPGASRCKPVSISNP